MTSKLLHTLSPLIAAIATAALGFGMAQAADAPAKAAAAKTEAAPAKPAAQGKVPAGNNGMHRVPRGAQGVPRPGKTRRSRAPSATKHREHLKKKSVRPVTITDPAKCGRATRTSTRRCTR